MYRLFLKSTLYILRNSCPRTGGVDRSVGWHVRVDQTPCGGLSHTDHGQGQGERHLVCAGECLHAGLLPTLPLHQGLILQLYRGADEHSKRERERERSIISLNVCMFGGSHLCFSPKILTSIVFYFIGFSTASRNTSRSLVQNHYFPQRKNFKEVMIH